MMYLFDCHIHTSHSPDSHTKPEEMVIAALKLGLNEITITDHNDLNYPPVSYDTFPEFDYGDYVSEIDSLNQKYEGKIRINRGVETGLQVRFEKDINNWFIGKEFDFIIGSTHVVDFADLYDRTFFIGKEQGFAIARYFEDVYNSITTFDMFHVYGHLDAVIRYTPDKTLDYHAYREIIDEILLLLIKKGKGIEINTSGYRYGVNAPHPSFEIIKRYKELGGEIITLGSDAHNPEHLAYNFNQVYELLRSAGFKAVTLFRGCRPVFFDI